MAALIAVICTLLPIGAQTLADRHSGWMMIDFRAYYCAALAQRERFDPYLVEPLHTCESMTPLPFYRAPDRVTVPAPYPPYALALLAPLTFLPFPIAAALWWSLLAACITAGAWALSKLIGRPFSIGWAAFALSLGLTCFPGGNAMPIAATAITFGAFFLQRGRALAASACVAIAMVEPNVALPAAIGLFVSTKSARVSLIVGAALLGALSMLAAGIPLNFEYLGTVVPAHALSEVSRDNQYSLSTVVAAFGLAEKASAMLGAASYLLMTFVGVIVGLILRRRYRDPAFAIVIPTAFALLGGSFVHTEAIAAAVAAALLLFSRTNELRTLSIAAVLLLTVPWMLASSMALFIVPILPVAYLIHQLWNRERVAWASGGVAAAAIIAVLFVFASAPAPHVIPQLVQTHAFIDPKLAEASWRNFVLGNVTNRAATWLLRAPSWLGLILVVGVAITLCRRFLVGKASSEAVTS
ncbi:MAG TPA: glycosyltransferase family 87 protein [Candidatus Tumulicola sp.]